MSPQISQSQLDECAAREKCEDIAMEVPREFVATAVDIYEWARELSIHSKAALNEAQLIRHQHCDFEQLKSQLDHTHLQLDQVTLQLEQVTLQKEALLRSTSWRATAPVRAFVTIAKNMLGRRQISANPETPELRDRLQDSVAIDIEQPPLNSPESEELPSPRNIFHIVCTGHTNYVANILKMALQRYGFSPTVAQSMPDIFDADYYIVVCPQMFDRLPPFNKLICFQLEQSVSSRWLNGQYLDILKNCKYVLDYSLDNIRYLDGFGISYPKVFHVPVLPVSKYGEFLASQGVRLASAPQKDTDVLFYGDTNVGRRAKLLSELSGQFNIKIINGLFGTELLSEIRRSKAVLNLHYYDGALLETTRVSECLSLGVPVVSESVFDAEHHKKMSQFVHFAECGDVDDISDKLQNVLNDQTTLSAADLSQMDSDFIFSVGRFLLAMNVINYKLFSERNRDYIIPSTRIALSLPETWKRRQFLNRSLDSDTFIFDGVRASPGWVGAASSYKFIAERLLDKGVYRAMIYEDDADFYGMTPAEIDFFSKKIDDTFGEWDVISCFLGDLHPDAKVGSVVDIDGILCASIDRMISTVCNIYNRRALERMASWDPTNLDSSNTIDRYLERQADLRVITSVPFLVEHEEALDSSLWSIQNAGMATMIQSSKRTLRDKIWHYHALKLLAERGGRFK